MVSSQSAVESRLLNLCFVLLCYVLPTILANKLLLLLQLTQVPTKKITIHIKNLCFFLGSQRYDVGEILVVGL